MNFHSPIFVTTALPYANGPIHLGHLLEHIQADVWVRFQKMKGKNCFFVCADDAHGTPVMLKAKQMNKPIEQVIADIQKQHIRSFKHFLIDHDVYHSTHSKENQRWVYAVYDCLVKKDLIESKVIQQLYDVKEGIFLPDRYVIGTCPNCKARDQYGDGCEKCGSVYSPSELIEPVSSVSKTIPEERESTHQFFCLDKLQDYLTIFLKKIPLESSIYNKLQEWFGQKLRAWDITRDAPYFGFLIPECDQKYFYVWLDAPLGYFAAIEKLCDFHGQNAQDYLHVKKPCTLYHFIGKDIIYFHGLFWPAMLFASNLKLPNNLFVHGFLNVDGQKMSKSRGTFIEADEYIKHLPAESLRYFLASRLNSTLEDVNLDFLELKQKFNSDLVGKVINIASRTAKFLHQHFDGCLNLSVEAKVIDEFEKIKPKIESAYEQREFSKAVKLIIKLSDVVNQYISDQAPWAMIKTSGANEKVFLVCNTAIQSFRWLMVFLKPIVPNLVKDAEHFLSINPLIWEDANRLLNNHKIHEFKPMLNRIHDDQIKTFIQHI